jgi:hypothetical protein
LISQPGRTRPATPSTENTVPRKTKETFMTESSATASAEVKGTIRLGSPYPFRFVRFIRTDGLPILSLAMWLLGVVVGAGVVLFNTVGLVRVSRHAESVSRRARDETRSAALMYGLPWFRGWKDDRVARRRLVFMTIWGILVGMAILADSCGYRP